jgi:hypothetical protein
MDMNDTFVFNQRSDEMFISLYRNEWSDFSFCITDIREYDVIYYQRAAIDMGTLHSFHILHILLLKLLFMLNFNLRRTLY